MNYNSKSLLDVKFDKNVKGYDALQVDETLDQVIEDYEVYDKKIAQDKKTIDELKAELSKVKEDLFNAEVEAKKYKNIVDSIPNDPNVSKQNIVYLKRIADLEAALYKKGVDPKKI